MSNTIIGKIMDLKNIVTVAKKHKTAICILFLLGTGSSLIYISSLKSVMVYKYLLIPSGAVLIGLGTCMLIRYLCGSERSNFDVPTVRQRRESYTMIQGNNEEGNELSAALESYLDTHRKFKGVITMLNNILNERDNFDTFYQSKKMPSDVLECRNEILKMVETAEKINNSSYKNCFDKISLMKGRSHLEAVNKANQTLKVEMSNLCKEAVKWKEKASKLLLKHYSYKLKLPTRWKEIMQESESSLNDNFGDNINYRC